ncbi:hypothetical protein FB45DRAFT_905957 [Roridomyces roridus]|uniref:Uncharacterized protein n=1 Tax=Roridomyces roridus TaxID=1738132 RepID=A0AAD7FS66_9AGAR|nr:hypothetical protein FB45DRAFT_905957 [Roridomyces roridus]
MPPKTQPKVFQVLVKTHTLTVLTTVAPTISINALKAEVLSALSSEVNQVEDVPRVTSADDFELCKAVKERGKLKGEFTVLDEHKLSIRDAGVANWEPLFIQFRDDSGDLLPVAFTPFEDDDDEVTPQFVPAPQPEESTSRGKRKTRPD